MSTPRTNTLTLAKALDVLARDIQSEDGVANAVIEEAAERLRELAAERDRLMSGLFTANDACRSAAAVAGRRGHETNWPAFERVLKQRLVEQHALLKDERARRASETMRQPHSS